MAELGSSDITATIVKNTVGGTSWKLSELCRQSIEKDSFYRPQAIEINGTSKAYQLVSSGGVYKLGDFRRYNHTALTPQAPSDFTRNWGPGGTTFSITFSIKIERLNIKELLPSTTAYWTVVYYGSASDRTSRINALRTWSPASGSPSPAVSLSTETPPTGHTNNQTQSPSSSLDIITDTAVPTSIVSSPDDTLYCEIFVSNSSGGVLFYLDDGYIDINTHESQSPLIVKNGFNYTISGYTSSFIVVNNSSSACAGADQNPTFGSSAASFYVHLVGLSGGTWYRLGATSISMQLEITGGILNPGNYTLNTSSLSSSANTQEVTSDFWGTGNTWEYDNVGQIRILSVSGVTQGSACTP